MNKSLLILSLGFAVACMPAAEARKHVAPAQGQEDLALVSAFKKKAELINKAAEKKKWMPGTESRFRWEGTDWQEIFTNHYTYNQADGRLSTIESEWELTMISYNEDGYVSETNFYYKNGPDWVLSSKTQYKYDDVIPGYVVERLYYRRDQDNEFVLDGGSRVNITRNAAGNITKVQSAQYMTWAETPGWEDSSWYTAIEYGSDGKANKISEYELDYDTNKWEVVTSYENIVWYTTDGQILDSDWDDADFFLGANRMKSADVKAEFSATTLKLTVEYPSDKAYKCQINMGSELVYSEDFKILDENGSYERTEYEIDFDFDDDLNQWVKDEVNTYWTKRMYDAYGNILDEESIETGDDYSDRRVQTCAVTSNPQYGYPLEYVYTTKWNDEPAQKTERIVFGDYVEVVDNIHAVIADENAPVEYYNLQGVRVENPSAGLFIRRQGSATQKVIIR